MNRWLPYMPPRWRNASIALAALGVIGRVLGVLARPTNIAILDLAVTLILTAVLCYAVVYVVYVVTSIVRR